ncbi:MAG: flagellar hook assembly protein FlgD [Pseudomonadales bacterium]
MDDLSRITGSANPLDALALDNRVGAEDETKKNELGQNAFLELMITQLSNQDPLSPQEGAEFVAQLAQFSSVEGIQNLNTTVNDLAGSFRSSQALQASALVGRSVRVPTDFASLATGEPVKGSVELPLTTNQLQIDVYDSAGQLVSQRSLGAQAAGDVDFTWDGIKTDGTQAEPGEYQIRASALIEGENTELVTHLNANIDSVTLGQGSEVTLNVARVGPVALADVKELF